MIVDLRNIYRPDDMVEHGFVYESIGRRRSPINGKTPAELHWHHKSGDDTTFDVNAHPGCVGLNPRHHCLAKHRRSRNSQIRGSRGTGPSVLDHSAGFAATDTDRRQPMRSQHRDLLMEQFSRRFSATQDTIFLSLAATRELRRRTRAEPKL